MSNVHIRRHGCDVLLPGVGGEHVLDLLSASADPMPERRRQQLEWWTAQNGKQAGDPAKLARALITIVNEQPPP